MTRFKLTNFSTNRRSISVQSWRATITSALVCGLYLLTSCATVGTEDEAQRILFIGNSVTYTNNLPAVFDRISESQPKSSNYRTDMYARGGATLTEFAQDATALDLLRSGRYKFVVLQERGGDDLCMLSQEDRETSDCQSLINSHVQLAQIAREHGARVLYLGTYQFAPRPSQSLVRAERELAGEMNAEYVEISESLRDFRKSEPNLPWIYVDKGHPGIATTALMGVRLYEAMSGHTPSPFALCAGFEMYTPKWKHDGPMTHPNLVVVTQPTQCFLNEPEMRSIIANKIAAGPIVPTDRQGEH